MKTYTVRCEWDPSGCWVVTVPEVAGAISQAHRLDQVPGDIAEILELMTGEKAGSYALTIEPVYPGPAGVAAREAAALRAQVAELSKEAANAVREAIIALRGEGLTLRDSAALAGVSYQRAQQIERSTLQQAS